MKRYILALLVVLADQLSKRYVEENVPVNAARPVIGDSLRVLHLRNYGSAMGLFQGRNRTHIALALAGLGGALSGFFAAERRGGKGLYPLSFALLVGGGLGNLISRLRCKYVTDFIQIRTKTLRNLPVFNIADIAVVLGSALFAAAEAGRGGREFLKRKK